jgi:signal transduction histidine kinase
MDMFSNDVLYLPNMDEWIFQKGHNPVFSNTNLDVSSWKPMTQDEILSIKLDENRSFEGWFRVKFELDSSLLHEPLYIFSTNTAATDVYFNGELVKSFGNTGIVGDFEKNILQEQIPEVIPLEIEKEYTVAIRFKEEINSITALLGQYNILASRSFLLFLNKENVERRVNQYMRNRMLASIQISVVILVTVFFWILVFILKEKRHLILIAIAITSLLIAMASPSLGNSLSDLNPWNGFFTLVLDKFAISLTIVILPFITVQSLDLKPPKWMKTFLILSMSIVPFFFFLNFAGFQVAIGIISISISLFYIISSRKTLKRSQWALAIGICILVTLFLVFAIRVTLGVFQGNIGIIPLLVTAFPLMLLVYVAFWLKETIENEKLQAKQLIKINEEKKNILEKQNIKLETQVKDRTKKLSKSLEDLKSTQAQLIQSEKMASLGELTAGIAHEIQNPLNFVNNFSEVSGELLTEVDEELASGNIDDAREIISDLKENLTKINDHGERASSIVKGMLDHSGTSSGERQPTDVN